MTLDKLETERAEMNTKLPPTMEEACDVIDRIQVRGR